MSLSDLASLGSFVSGVAVLVSLVYLALQVRQAEKNQQANVRQQRASRTVTLNMGIATEPSLVEAVGKAINGDKDVSRSQLSQFWFYSLAIFNSVEDSFYQHRDGLITDRDFSAVMNGARRTFAISGFRVMWKWQRANYGQEFAEFMDTLLAAPVPLMRLDPATWLRDLAREEATPGAQQSWYREPATTVSEA
jgi:hypothetical protein